MSDVVFGIVLAGGRGQRVGGAKHRLRLGGHSLLEHAIARAAPQVERLLLSCNDPELHALPGVEAVLRDPLPGFRGPLAGVLAGLEHAGRHAPDTTVVSIAVDTPWFPLDLAARFAQARAADRAEIAVAASGGSVHPVFALWPAGLAPALRALLESPARAAVRDFQALHRTVVVEWPRDRDDPFMNVNTKEDLAAAERMLREGRAAR